MCLSPPSSHAHERATITCNQNSPDDLEFSSSSDFWSAKDDTPLVTCLHWLWVTDSIRIKALTWAYRLLNSTAPSYLNNLYHPLQDISDCDNLVISRYAISQAPLIRQYTIIPLKGYLYKIEYANTFLLTLWAQCWSIRLFEFSVCHTGMFLMVWYVANNLDHVAQGAHAFLAWRTSCLWCLYYSTTASLKKSNNLWSFFYWRLSLMLGECWFMIRVSMEFFSNHYPFFMHYLFLHFAIFLLLPYFTLHFTSTYFSIPAFFSLNLHCSFFFSHYSCLFTFSLISSIPFLSLPFPPILFFISLSLLISHCVSILCSSIFSLVFILLSLLICCFPFIPFLTFPSPCLLSSSLLRVLC